MRPQPEDRPDMRPLQERSDMRPEIRLQLQERPEIRSELQERPEIGSEPRETPEFRLQPQERPEERLELRPEPVERQDQRPAEKGMELEEESVAGISPADEDAERTKEEATVTNPVNQMWPSFLQLLHQGMYMSAWKMQHKV